MKPLNLQFEQGEAGSFTFDTGVLKGVLRQEGRSIGLVPVTYTAGESAGARSRLVVLPDPTEAEFLEITNEFLKVSSQL